MSAESQRLQEAHRSEPENQPNFETQTIPAPLAELRKQGHINARARAADTSANFSQLIRQGLPDPNL